MTLHALPKTLDSFVVADNQFSGTLDFARLPPSMFYLDVKMNAFSGSFDMNGISQAVTVVKASCNSFSGVAVVPNREIKVELYGCRHLTGVVDESGKTHRSDKEILYR